MVHIERKVKRQFKEISLAITTESFNADGTSKIYTTASTILSQSHCRVDLYYDEVDHEINQTLWDVINNSIVFNDAPLLGQTVKITISTDGEGLETAPSLYSDVASNITSIITVASIEQDIKDVSSLATQITSVAADKATLDSLFNDKATLDSLYTDKATLDSLFNDKATLDSLYADKATLDSLYTDKASLDAIYSNLTEILEVRLRAWEAEASKRTANSYASEPEDVFVNITTSNGDGTFTITPTTAYSALHYRNKTSDIAGGSLIAANNLDDLQDVVTARSNLGVSIGSDIPSLLQTVSTATKYDDATTGVDYKLYIDNGDIILEEI